MLGGVNGRLILGRLADQALLVRKGHVGRGDAVAWYWMLDVKVGGWDEGKLNKQTYVAR